MLDFTKNFRETLSRTAFQSEACFMIESYLSDDTNVYGPDFAARYDCYLRGEFLKSNFRPFSEFQRNVVEIFTQLVEVFAKRFLHIPEDAYASNYLADAIRRLPNKNVLRQFNDRSYATKPFGRKHDVCRFKDTRSIKPVAVACALLDELLRNVYKKPRIAVFYANTKHIYRIWSASGRKTALEGRILGNRVDTEPVTLKGDVRDLAGQCVIRDWTPECDDGMEGSQMFDLFDMRREEREAVVIPYTSGEFQRNFNKFEEFAALHEKVSGEPLPQLASELVALLIDTLETAPVQDPEKIVHSFCKRAEHEVSESLPRDRSCVEYPLSADTFVAWYYVSEFTEELFGEKALHVVAVKKRDTRRKNFYHPRYYDVYFGRKGIQYTEFETMHFDRQPADFHELPLETRYLLLSSKQMDLIREGY